MNRHTVPDHDDLRPEFLQTPYARLAHEAAEREVAQRQIELDAACRRSPDPDIREKFVALELARSLVELLGGK